MTSDSLIRVTTPDGVSLAVHQRSGRGIPLLLLHGTLLDSTIFTPVLDRLDQRHSLALDLRGCGASGEPDSDSIPFTTHVSDVLIVINHLINGPFHLIGLSLGGILAVAVAHRLRQQVQSLTLIGTSVDRELAENIAAYTPLADAITANGIVGPLIEIGMTAYLAPAGRDNLAPDGPRARLAKIFATQPKKGAAACFRGGLQRPDLTTLLPALTMPTLSLIGSADTVFSPRRQHTTAEHIPQCHIESLIGCGHIPTLEQPDAVGTLIGQHLQAAESLSVRH